MSNAINSFNLRVYGLLFHEGQVLVTHENRAGMLMTKFPGGGLEFGEGLAEGLKREFVEELQLEVSVGELYYVNDFLQISRFRKSDQLISFYYLVESEMIADIRTESLIEGAFEGEQIFEWFSIDKLNPDIFTFPLDIQVAKKLSQTL